MTEEIVTLIDQYLNEFKSRERRTVPFTYEEIINMLLDLRGVSKMLVEMEKLK